jgi:hypothetical protein
MSTSSSSSHDYHRSPFGPPVSEKLTRDNYLLWKAQVLPPIRGAHLDGHLDGSDEEPPKHFQVVKDDKTKEEVPNPTYSTWLAHDQQVLGHLLNSLTKYVLGQVAMASTVAEAWAILEDMFSVQSHGRVTNLRMQYPQEGELDNFGVLQQDEGPW